MSTKKECDRCGTQVDDGKFVTNEWRRLRLTGLNDSDGAYTPENVELCESCANAVRRFVKEAPGRKVP